MSSNDSSDRERWTPGDDIPTVAGVTGVGTWKSYAPDVCNRCEIEFHDDRGYGTRDSELQKHIDAEHPRKCHGHGCDQIAAYAIGGGYTYGCLCAQCAHRLVENDPPPFSAWYRLTNEANADAPLLPEDHPAEVALTGLYGSPDEKLVAGGGTDDRDNEQCHICGGGVDAHDECGRCPTAEDFGEGIQTDGGTKNSDRYQCSRQGCDEEARWRWWNGMGVIGRFCDDHARDQLDEDHRCPITRPEDVSDGYVLPAGIQPVGRSFPTIRTVGAFDRYLETDGDEPRQCSVAWCSGIADECIHSEKQELATDGGAPTSGKEQSPPGVRDLHIAYGGDPDEYDRMTGRYLHTGKSGGEARD